MTRTSALLIAFGLAAFACSTAPDGAPTGPIDQPPPVSWPKAMKEIDEHYTKVQDLLLSSPMGDLKTVAAAADRAAYLVRFGYGKFENKRVPEFARMARECESWLLTIADEARQGRGELAREAFMAGGSHCTKCHDESDKVQW